MNKAQKRLILFILFVSLLSLPFFWSGQNLYHLGGDDSRLYLYSPSSWLNNISLWSWFFYAYAPQHASLLFAFLAAGIKRILFFLNIQKVIYGLTLSLGFLSAYLLLQELIQNKEDNYSFIASIIGGLAYVFLPILFYLEWPAPMFSLYGIFVFPLVLLCFMRAISRRMVSYLVLGSVIGAVFGATVASIPWSLAFLIGSSVFLLLFLLMIEKEKPVFVKYLAIYVGIFILINSFWIVPFVSSMVFERATLSYSSAPQTRGAEAVIKALAREMSMADTLSGLPSRKMIYDLHWPHGEVAKYTFRLTFLSILMLGIMFSGFLIKSRRFLRERKLLIALGLTTLILAYFETVNIGDWSIRLFVWLTENIPGWIMFRNFYDKFSLAYSFFYAMTLGVSVYLILKSISKEIIRKSLVFVLFLIILLQSLPFLFGEINNLPLQPGTQVGKNVKFPKYYLDSIKRIESLGDGRVLTLPLTNISWSTFLSSDRRGMYVGLSPLRILAGRDDYNSAADFESMFPDVSAERVDNALLSEDYTLLKRLFGLLNIRYIFYNADIYSSEIPDDLRNDLLWSYDLFSHKSAVDHLISNIARKKIALFGPVTIYELDNKVFTPLIYPATQGTPLVRGVDDLVSVLKADHASFSERVFFFLEPKEIIYGGEDWRIWTTKNRRPDRLSFEKLSPVAYRVKVKGARGPFFLVFSEPYHTQWKAYKGSVNWFNVLWKKPIAERSHRRANGNANSWYVDERGDFEITLYFWSQSLFYIGAIVSITTLVVAVGFLFYDWRKKWLLGQR